jgi:hypothetical protein
MTDATLDATLGEMEDLVDRIRKNDVDDSTWTGECLDVVLKMMGIPGEGIGDYELMQMLETTCEIWREGIKAGESK